MYLLVSEADRTKTYVGFSEDMRQRLLDHNAGKSACTRKSRSWRVETYLAFSDRECALDFERYLVEVEGGKQFLIAPENHEVAGFPLLALPHSP